MLEDFLSSIFIPRPRVLYQAHAAFTSRDILVVLAGLGNGIASIGWYPASLGNIVSENAFEVNA